MFRVASLVCVASLRVACCVWFELVRAACRRWSCLRFALRSSNVLLSGCAERCCSVLRVAVVCRHWFALRCGGEPHNRPSAPCVYMCIHMYTYKHAYAFLDNTCIRMLHIVYTREHSNVCKRVLVLCLLHTFCLFGRLSPPDSFPDRFTVVCFDMCKHCVALRPRSTRGWRASRDQCSVAAGMCACFVCFALLRCAMLCCA